MEKMIEIKKLESDYGVPAKMVQGFVKRYHLDNQKVGRNKWYITLQDAEKIVFDYYVRQNSYTWSVVATRLKTDKNNKRLRGIINSIIPNYYLNGVTYYPICEIEDLLHNIQHYHLKIYKNKHYYLEGSREDFYISNYFTLSEFKTVFEQKYSIKPTFNSFKTINKLRHDYPVEQVKLFGMKEYVMHRKYFSQLLEDYYIYCIAKKEQNLYRRYEIESTCSEFEANKFKKTLYLIDGFAKQRISTTKIQKEKAIAIASLKQFLIKNLAKEIYLCSNDEIRNLLTKTNLGKYGKEELYQFLNYVIRECDEDCAFNLAVSRKKVTKVKTEQDFYSMREWEGYVNFIFDIDLHIEKAFANPLYAKYWLFTMLQCSLAWRSEDILNMPALYIGDIKKYSLKWFEQNKFTSAVAWNIINSAKNFIEQDRVNKTGAKKHFIILNSFAVATAIGFIICEQHRQSVGSDKLFGQLKMDYKTMVRLMGNPIQGFSNLKATRTILSFANETASHLDYSGQAVSIASYMRSHIVGKSGFSDTTSIYLKSSFDEKELLSLPVKMGELGLFGWLYHEILTALNENPKCHEAELIGDIRNDVSPIKLNGYSNYLVQEQKKRNEIIAEIIGHGKGGLKELCVELQNGTHIGRKDNIYCVKSSCIYPLSYDCELCEYAIPSIHVLHVIGQEASELLDKLIGEYGTDVDKEKYSYQLCRLLGILKEAREEFGEEFVASFADYESIKRKLEYLHDAEKGVK